MNRVGITAQQHYDVWFKQLQALTSLALEPEDWTGRWYDGFTPAEALQEGSEGQE